MRYKKSVLAALCGTALFVCQVQAAKLSILIDDFGYRQHEENQVLQMPKAVSVAIFPNAPDSQMMMNKAHQQGREILIHLPMAPLSKQPLEKNTLTPSMSAAEVKRIVDQAISNIPYAIGINNHMGSAMTSSLSGMENVMQAMNAHNLFFLDSMTIGNTQSVKAAQGTRVKVIKRNVFLDDVQNEAEIRRQFERAIQLARKNGYAIAIGHPHPTTVKVLQQMLPNLPSDIVLVRPSDLLDEAQRSAPSGKPVNIPPAKPSRKGISQCRTKHPVPPVYAGSLFTVVGESLQSLPAIQFAERQYGVWVGLIKK
ncbi:MULTISPECIES: divergent polysaccharide deacetylase family protein [Rahnella]|uniref:Divergent polysaccharide deacetylase family protein n=1 Tax=Rahnella laticis TaxID=2787622 RepID=A0ABS0EDV1_9GAMM|nr:MULTISPECIES: divergent polysaccharide deacetylase family protein [Rahnella]MBF7982335.1 divergent polysaccharide deacetylase family protein [Rahnella laticis]MBF7997394.1 divergent polysaccharide deacetylase family protein [Rahnella laticis]MBF8002425.1 divergent polysaccharide deacetylase family protein [Rahnella sp. LAC-M12]